MVDQDLKNEMRQKFKYGNGTAEDILSLFEIYKQLSLEDKRLEAEFEDMGMLDMDFTCKINISNENKSYWLSFKKGKVYYGEGDIQNPSLNFTTNIETFAGILFGQVEISSAHEAGRVSFDGPGEALMDLQAITSVINEFLQNN